MATSTFAEGSRIVRDTDSSLQDRIQESSKEKLVSIAPVEIGTAPIVKSTAQKTRIRGKKFRSRPPSELDKLDANWLNLSGVVVEGQFKEIKGRFAVVQAHFNFEVMPCCPECHRNESVIRWDLRDRNIKDAERDIKLVLIVLIVQRFYCNSCKETFTPLLAFLADGRLSRTERLSQRASALTFERRTTSDIAWLTGLSRRLVQHLAWEAVKNLPTPQEVFLKVTTK